MDIQVLARGRFVPLPDARATAISSNAYTVRIPIPAPKDVRRGAEATEWDDAIFLMGGVESEPAVGSGEGADYVEVSVFVLNNG